MGTPPPIEMANLGMADSLILMVLALVVFGPRRLPQIGRQIGKLMYEFRKASNDFKYQMEEELRNAEEADRHKKEEERLKALALASPAQTIESTHLSETNPAATDSAGETLPAASGDAGAAGPYPRLYPDAIPGEVEYPAGVSAAAHETAVEQPYPRIQPPSTGEQVRAEARSAPAVSPAADSVAEPAASPDPETAPEQAQEQQPPAATEPVSKHG